MCAGQPFLCATVPTLRGGTRYSGVPETWKDSFESIYTRDHQTPWRGTGVYILIIALTGAAAVSVLRGGACHHESERSFEYLSTPRDLKIVKASILLLLLHPKSIVGPPPRQLPQTWTFGCGFGCGAGAAKALNFHRSKAGANKFAMKCQWCVAMRRKLSAEFELHFADSGCFFNRGLHLAEQDRLGHGIDRSETDQG